MAVTTLPKRLIEEPKERSLLQDSMVRFLRNRIAVVSLLFIVFIVLVAIFAPFFAPQSFDKQTLELNNAIPEWMLPLLPAGAENYARISSEYPLGADHLGRDLLSRTIYGARVSLSVAFVASFVSLVVGTTYGMISGYFGGIWDKE